MTRQCHNHTLQTYPWSRHHEESHRTQSNDIKSDYSKATSSPSLPQRTIAKQETTLSNAQQNNDQILPPSYYHTKQWVQQYTMEQRQRNHRLGRLD